MRQMYISAFLINAMFILNNIARIKIFEKKVV